LSQKEVDEIAKTIPELPAAKRKKYLKFGLSKEDVEVLVSNKYLTEIYEHALEREVEP